VFGAVVSLAWNEAVGQLWHTDAHLFGVAVRPARQRDLLAHEPWTFVAAAARTVGRDGWAWAKGLLTVGPSVAVWPTIAALAVLALLILLSLQRSACEPAGLGVAERVLLLVVFTMGSLLVMGAQYVYWSVPGADAIGGMRARFFVPLLVLLPIATGPRHGRWADPVTARVPLAVLAVPAYVALLATITLRMY
jgi:hypothetical protein